MSSHHNSLRWRSGVNLVVIAAALVAITVITNAYSFNLMLRNFRQSLSSTAQIYTEQISGKVDKINSGSLELVSLAASSQNYYTSSPLGRYLTQQDILTRLQDRIRYVESSDLYFFYRTDSDELLTALSNRPSTGSSYFWNQYLMLPPTQPANTWFSVTCNGETWLMCYYNVSQVRVGAAVRAKTLLQSLYADTGLVQDSGFALAGLDGTIVYSSQPDLMACGTNLAGHIPASLIVESHTVPEVGTLLLFRPSSDLLHQLSGSFGWLLLLNLLALALITTMLLNTNRHITVPIQQLTEGVREVERGNWDYQLETSSQIEDFQQLFRGFNHMILEVHDLKISAYEAELERHRNELRYLQLQIRPHFYLNAITTISSLIYQDRKQDARSFIDFLSDYLRYLFSGSDTQVTLQQETKHCKSFIQLQQIKYPDTIFYMFELASGTENIRIPKFLLNPTWPLSSFTGKLASISGENPQPLSSTVMRRPRTPFCSSSADSRKMLRNCSGLNPCLKIFSTTVCSKNLGMRIFPRNAGQLPCERRQRPCGVKQPLPHLAADLWPRRQPAHQQRRTEWCSRYHLFARGGKPCTS